MARAIRSSDRTQTDLRAELLTLENVSVGYGDGFVIEDVTFNVRRGEVAGLVALDGRGKSTVIRCAAGLLQPATGTVRYEGRDVYGMSFSEDQRFRTRSAIVLEGGALFQNRSILDNVTLPVRYHLGGSLTDVTDFARRWLERVGYTESLTAFPWQVSARGRRLAAFARALVREPELVLIDRFFESLDVADWKRLMELVLELNVKNGTSFLLVGRLHPTIFQCAERVVVLEGGKLVAHDFKRGLYKNPHIKQAFESGDEEEKAPRVQTSERRRVEVEGAKKTPSGRTEPALSERMPARDEISELPPVPLDAIGSEGFDPQSSESDMEPVVVVDDRPSDEAPIPGEARVVTPSSLDDEAPETTLTIGPDATAAIIAEARRRHADKIEEEASATERGASPKLRSVGPDTASTVLDRRALEAALRIADEGTQPPAPPKDTVEEPAGEPAPPEKEGT